MVGKILQLKGSKDSGLREENAFHDLVPHTIFSPHVEEVSVINYKTGQAALLILGGKRSQI